jgi:hypothetical protein
LKGYGSSFRGKDSTSKLLKKYKVKQGELNVEITIRISRNLGQIQVFQSYNKDSFLVNISMKKFIAWQTINVR